MPPLVLRVELGIEVAGRRFSQTFAATPNQTIDFAWDGLDAYGRRVQGRQPLTVHITYFYTMLRQIPASVASSFGLFCYGSAGNVLRPFFDACVVPPELLVQCTCSTNEVPMSRDFSLWIGELDTEAAKNGGWSVSAHHVFDPLARVLYLGNGERREATNILSTVGGTGKIGTVGDSGSALQAQFDDASGLAMGPDGSIYVWDFSYKVRRIRPNGTISVVAGTGTYGNTGDGGPATQATLGVGALALGPDGSLYLAERNFGVVRKVAPDGTITRVAGDPTIAFCDDDGEVGNSDTLFVRMECVKDDGPALQASLWGPYGIAVGPDGSIYIADGNNLVRKVSPNGVISSIAGGGFRGLYCDYGVSGYQWSSIASCGDGGAARLAGFDVPRNLAVGPDGSIYTKEDQCAIRRIKPDGIVVRVAGKGTSTSDCGYSGDGGLATQAKISSQGGIAVGQDGSVYFTDFKFVRKIGPDGIITTIAGTGANGAACGDVTPVTCTDGQPATQVPITPNYFWGQVALGPDGSVYFPTFSGDNRIRRIVPFYKPSLGGDITIASAEGGEIYEFDATGRHLRTRDALTNVVVFSFGYDGSGRLTTVTDGDGNVSQLERNGSAQLTAAVSPFGQRTTVTVDGYGHLATVTNPAAEVVTVQHDSLGLLLSLTDAKNNPAHQFTYDSLGRLTRDQNPGGGYKTLTRAETDSSVSVNVTTALGRVTKHGFTNRKIGGTRWEDTDAAGLSTVSVEGTDGTTTVTSPDGSISTTTATPSKRFGMQAPIPKAFSVTLPSALTLTGTSTQQVTLANANDPLTLLTEVDSATINGRTFVSSYTASTRTLTQTSAEGRQTVTRFDSLGRVLQVQAPGVAAVNYTYGGRGLLTSMTQAGRQLAYSYDSAGRVARVTDPLGRVEQYAYDSVGRVRTQTLPDGRTISYAYDANGNLTSLTPPTKPAHAFAFNATDQDSVYSPPTAGLAVSKTKYTYNLDQQLTQVLRPDSLTLAIVYDTAGRAKTLRAPGDSVQVSYSATTGLVTSLARATGSTLAFTYDGLLPKSFTWSGSVGGSVGLSYDADFRVTALTVNGSNSVAFAYDKDNLLKTAGALTLTREAVTGRLKADTLGSVTRSYSYSDSVGALTRATAKHDTTTLYDAQYTRDSVDRITQLVETVQGTATTYAFAYDTIGRLKTVRVGGTLVSTYGYDGNGNRTSLTTQSGTITGTVDDQDRPLTYGSNTYTYTANGELKTKITGTDTTRYSYDVFGNLVQVKLPTGTTIDYLVDGQNRRIGKKVNGARVQGFLYQGQLAPIAELDSMNSVVSRFVYGTRVNVPEYLIKGGVTYRLVTDHVGSVRLVVNASTGGVVQRLDYDESGRVTTNSSPGFQPFGYAGGLYDADTKLARFGARDYDAETGRWTSKDPILWGGRSSNLFAYAFEDPLNRVDPDGRQAIAAPSAPSPFPIFPPWQPIDPALKQWLDQTNTGIAGWVDSQLLDLLRTIRGACKDLTDRFLANAGRGRGANRGPNDEANRIAREEGLNRAGQRALHDAISGKGYSAETIREIARELAKQPKYRDNP